MKYIIFSICSILITFSSASLNGQDNTDSLISNNNVKSIYEIRYKIQNGKPKGIDTVGYKFYNADFRLIEEYSKKAAYKYKYEYSLNGLMTKKVELDNRNDKEVKRVWTYEYDRNDRLIKEVSYWTDSETNYPILYSYDEENQSMTIEYLDYKKEAFKSICQKYYESGEIYEQTYEEKYKKSAFKIERFDKCGNLIYLYQYGKENNLEMHHSFISFCSDLLKREDYLIDTLYTQNKVGTSVQYVIVKNNRKSIYSYDSIGNLFQVAKFQFKEDETLNRSDEKTYNSKGQLIQSKEFYHWRDCNYSTDENKAGIQEKYEYYENGLLYKISISFFNKNSEDNTDYVSNDVTEYLIEYYQ